MVPEEDILPNAPKASVAGFAPQRALWWAIFPLGLVACWSFPFFLDPGQALLSLNEDGFIENVGAVLFFSAGALLLVTWADCRKRVNSLSLLLLALLMLFIAGEEISWGQRIFGWSTPAGYENVQGETTIHNHPWFDKTTAGLLSMNNLFEYFNTVYGFLLPLLAYFVASIPLLMRRWGIPLVPLAIGIAFPANYILSKLYQLIFDTEWIYRTAELRECAQAMVWFAVACIFFGSRRSLL